MTLKLSGVRFAQQHVKRALHQRNVWNVIILITMMAISQIVHCHVLEIVYVQHLAYAHLVKMAFTIYRVNVRIRAQTHVNHALVRIPVSLARTVIKMETNLIMKTVVKFLIVLCHVGTIVPDAIHTINAHIVSWVSMVHIVRIHALLVVRIVVVRSVTDRAYARMDFQPLHALNVFRVSTENCVRNLVLLPVKIKCVNGTQDIVSGVILKISPVIPVTNVCLVLGIIYVHQSVHLDVWAERVSRKLAFVNHV